MPIRLIVILSGHHYGLCHASITTVLEDAIRKIEAAKVSQARTTTQRIAKLEKYDAQAQKILAALIKRLLALERNNTRSGSKPGRKRR
jgi:hypothetical protein